MRRGCHLFLLFTLLQVCSVAASAQDLQVPENAITDFAKAMKLSSDDSRIQDIFKRMNLQMHTLKERMQTEQWAEKATHPSNEYKEIEKSLPFPAEPSFQDAIDKVKIFKHYRAPYGIPLKAPELKLALSPEEERQVKETQAHLQKAMLDSLEETKKQSLPACEQDRIDHKKLDPSPSQKKSTERIELLFLKSEQPRDVDEYFGKEVKVITCVKDGIDACVIPFAQVELTCLPSRIQISQKEIVLLEGLPALKNYDSKKDGELHLAVKAQLQKYLGR